MYYPKAKISTNQYTGGGLLKDTVTGETYRGYYYLTFDGRYFSGVSQSINSDELVLIQSSSIDTSGTQTLVTGPSINNFQYNTLTNNKMSFLNPGDLPTAIYPRPTANDYDSGQFFRYFMQRIGGNAKDIKEISSSGYTLIQKNPLYSSLSLIWKLTGPINDIAFPSYTVYGVASTNLRTVQSLEKTMKGISRYLVNPLELAKIITVQTSTAPTVPAKLKRVPTIYYQNQPAPNPVVPIIDDVLIDASGNFIVTSDGSYILVPIILNSLLIDSNGAFIIDSNGSNIISQ
jgi:hypothetical protein